MERLPLGYRKSHPSRCRGVPFTVGGPPRRSAWLPRWCSLRGQGMKPEAIAKRLGISRPNRELQYHLFSDWPDVANHEPVKPPTVAPPARDSQGGLQLPQNSKSLARWSNDRPRLAGYAVRAPNGAREVKTPGRGPLPRGRGRGSREISSPGGAWTLCTWTIAPRSPTEAHQRIAQIANLWRDRERRATISQLDHHVALYL